MNALPHPRAEILFVAPAPLAHTSILSGLGDTFHFRVAHDEEQALQHLRDPGLSLAVIVANRHLLQRIGSDLPKADQARHRHLIRLLIPDDQAPQADLMAINEAQVFRIFAMQMDIASARRHLGDAMDLHARQSREWQQLETSGPALRDALAFLAHEINTPLSLIQGYSHALINGSGVFSTAPAPTDTVKRALEATERNARHCLSLMTLVAETAQSAFAHRTSPSCNASDLLHALLNTYPFAGQEGEWVSIDVQHDFPIPSRHELLRMVLFTLTRNTLLTLHGESQPRLVIALGVDESTNYIRLASNGRNLPAETLDTLTSSSPASGSLGIGLAFCLRVMRTLRGEFQIVSPPGQKTVATLRLAPATAPGT